MKVNLIALACSVLLAVGFSVSSFAGSNVDTDSDGVPDGWDNCIEISNDQCDTDADGYGNICDCDFDQDGVGGVGDFGLFLANFGNGCGDPAYDEIYDMDCDCIVGVGDFGLFLGCFGENGYVPNISTGKVATLGNPISGLPCAAATYPPGAINCKEDF